MSIGKEIRYVLDTVSSATSHILKLTKFNCACSAWRKGALSVIFDFLNVGDDCLRLILRIAVSSGNYHEQNDDAL